MLRQIAAVAVLLAMIASVTDYPVRTPIFSGLFALMFLWYFSPGPENERHNGLADTPVIG